jgi:leucyl-tRNA synthetase
LEKSKDFDQHEEKLLDSKNYFVSGTTFNYKYSHQLSVAVSKMQGLTNSIRRAPSDVIAFGGNFERTLAALIIMMSPMAPHFASELWARFVNLKNRINVDSDDINWNEGVFGQKWPTVDQNYPLDLTFKVNNYQVTSIKIPHQDLNRLTHEVAFNFALNTREVLDYINNREILKSNLTVYPGYEGIVNIKIKKV